MWRNIGAVVVGLVVFVIAGMAIGGIRIYLRNKGLLAEGADGNWAVSIAHISSSMFLAGVVVGLLVRTRAWLWSLGVYVMYALWCLWFAIEFGNWDCYGGTGHVWGFAAMGAISLAALWAGAVLGSRVTRTRTMSG